VACDVYKIEKFSLLQVRCVLCSSRVYKIKWTISKQISNLWIF